MLTKLTVENFKRFRAKTEVNFEPITVLLGGNNSGKSTVLQALSIFQYCMDVTRKRKNGGFTLDTKTIGPEEFGALPVTEPTDLWPDSKANGAIHIEAKFSNSATISFEIKLSFNRFSITPSLLGETKKLIEETKVRYVPIHSGLALREEYLLAPARAERLRGLQHGSVIRNLLWDLKENNQDRWKMLKGILERLYPTATLDVNFDSQVDRFISSDYDDHVLERGLDVVVSGTGFQQVLQIFTGVLSQGSTIVLMDEPDAHLHARLQVEMMRIFEDLVEKEGLQFVLASHSPHLISAAPAGSLQAMIDGKAHPFATEPEQMDLLDTLGAFDRMEIVPLLRTKSVVFVENRDDRNFLELFARKLWGEAKARKIWDGVSFLYTYQEPVSADVKRLARQVKDLLNAPGLSDLHGGQPAKFLVIGDRDYRSLNGASKARKELEKKAKAEGFKLDLRCSIWSRNEIENYLLDASAIEKAAVKKAKDPSQTEAIKTAVQEAIQKSIAIQKSEVQQRIAAKLQHEDQDCRNDYVKATQRSEEILGKEWGDGMALCDAKKLFSQIRAEFQARKLKTGLSEADVVETMDDVPAEVKKVLKLIQGLTKGAGKSRKSKKVSPPATDPIPEVGPAKDKTGGVNE
jgi:predicted ATPase